MLRRLIFTALSVFTLSAATHAQALTTLKKIQITDGSRVDLYFDAKVSPHQIRTEFANDIIQLSLEDVSIYPAKITSIAGADLTKVFAYQYTPKLVRARFTVKGKAETYKDRLKVETAGKVLTVKIVAGTSDHVTTSASQAIRVESAPAQVDANQKALLEKVMKGAPDTAQANPLAAQQAVASQPAPSAPAQKEKKSSSDIQPAMKSMKSKGDTQLTSGKPLPTPWRSLIVLVGMIALFVGVLFAVKKLSGKRSIQGHKAYTGFLSKLGIGGKGRMIEVVSTHHLGPKKSISVVRVGGRTLVLGVTNDSINLITQIQGDLVAEFDSSDEKAAPPADPTMDLFGEALARESDLTPEIETVRPATDAARVPVAPQPAARPPSAPARPSVRAQIRSRLEGLKQL